MNPRMTIGQEKDGSRVVALAAACGAEGKNGRTWLLECACGNSFTATTTSIRSTKHKTRCTACTRKHLSIRNKGMGATHGESRSYLYNAWRHINRRCFNEKSKAFKNYGGRGITVVPEWRTDYAAFAAYIRAEIGDRPGKDYSLDRIDNDGNYAPGNLRWATSVIQANNRRISRCKGATERQSKPRGPVIRPVFPELEDEAWVRMLAPYEDTDALTAALAIGVSPTFLRKVSAIHGLRKHSPKRIPKRELPESLVPFSKTQRLSDLDSLI